MELIQADILSQLESSHSMLDRSNNQPSKPALIVALSGGLDSSVLLHAAHQLYLDKHLSSVRAVHANHGLQIEASEWSNFCRTVCSDYGIPLITEQLELAEKQESSEAAARNARYQLFESVLLPGEFLATAHHADDQVETLLFRLFRGTGLHGLTGMPKSRVLGKGSVIRPLINFTRKQLEQYAERFQLSWVNDPTNQESHYSRNFIRNKVIPLIATKWPQLQRTLINFSNLAAEQTEILQQVAEQDLQISAETKNQIDCQKLIELSRARQKNAVFYWLRINTGISPSATNIEQIVGQLSAASKKSIKIKIGNGWVRSFKNWLFYCSSDEPEVFEKAVVWSDLDKPLSLSNGVTICISKSLNPNINISRPIKNHLTTLPIRAPKDNEMVTVCTRHGGEVARPSYREKSTELKKIYQELEVPPWQREWIPLIYYNDDLVAAVGVFVSRDFCADTSGLVFKIRAPLNELMA
jgi:tRNA(Ile)-lysidine synthase